MAYTQRIWCTARRLEPGALAGAIERIVAGSGWHIGENSIWLEEGLGDGVSATGHTTLAYLDHVTEMVWPRVMVMVTLRRGNDIAMVSVEGIIGRLQVSVSGPDVDTVTHMAHILLNSLRLDRVDAGAD